MGIPGEGEARLHDYNHVPSIRLWSSHAIPTKLGQPQHVEPKDCGLYGRQGQGGAAAYGRAPLD